MPADPLLLNVADRLTPYSKVDLLSIVAALQLVPENANKAIRNETLAHVICSLPSGEGQPHISTPRLREVAALLERSQYRLAEDPCNNLFTEEFAFFGGAYVVFLGIDEGAAFIMKHLAKAIFRHPESFPHPRFRSDAHAILRFALALSNEIARRAGIPRGLAPANEQGSIFVPPGPRLTALKNAVVFTRPELNELLRRHGIEHLDSLPLTSIPGSINLEEYQPGVGGLFARPIVDFGDRVVVALPGSLLTAARNAILELAQQSGVSSELSDRFNLSVWISVEESLRNFGLESKGLWPSVPEGVRAGVFGLDEDKELVAILRTFSLDAYDPTDPYGNRRPGEGQSMEQVFSLIGDIELTMYSDRRPPNDILFLLIPQTFGTLSITAGPESEISHLVPIPANDLETISFLEHDDPLFLYKYAIVRKRTTERARLFAWSTLDELMIYRSKRNSFYMSDDERPNAIQIHCDGAGELRREVYANFDFHCVESITRGHSEVMARYEGSNIPIYFPPHYRGRRVAFLVEGVPSCWIYGPDYSENQQARHHHGLYVTFTEALAYWIWKAKDWLPMLAPDVARFNLELFISQDEDWNTFSALHEGDPVDFDFSPAERGTIRCIFHNNIYPLLNQRSNAGELEIIGRVFSSIAVAFGGTPDITDLLKAVAPVDTAKMILMINGAQNPELIDSNLPALRKVQKANQGLLLDELGGHLTRTVNWPVGPILGDQRVTVLNQAVAFFFGRLERLIESTDSTELLIHCMGQHEAAIQSSASSRFHAPSRLACFGDTSPVITEFSTEIREQSLAAVACRFLVEILATKSGRGPRPFSISL